MMFSDRNQDGALTIGGAESEILQEAHYYPFGMEMAGKWSVQVGTKSPYLYNGKELEEDFGLNLSDYGARWYDAAIGRWTSVDPLAEMYSSHSPYNYTLNNPVANIDPDGRSTWNSSWAKQNAGDASLGLVGNRGEVNDNGIEAKRNQNEEERERKRNLTSDEQYAIDNSYPAFDGDYSIRHNGVGIVNLLNEFVNGMGPKNSVFLGQHPLTESLKNIKEVQRLRYLMYMKYNGKFKSGASYTKFAGKFGLQGIVNAGTNITYQFVGTFSGDVRVSEDGKNLIFVISDSKSQKSLFYRLGSEPDRTQGGGIQYLRNNFQKYVWMESIDPNFFRNDKKNAPNGRDKKGYPLFDKLKFIRFGEY